MAHFKIPRKTWYRGNITGSKLLREDGLRCCIGHVCQQVGIADRHIWNVTTLAHKRLNDEGTFGYSIPDSERAKLPTWMLEELPINFIEVDICSCYTTNDQLSIDNGTRDMLDSEREAILIERFAKRGETLEFVD